VAGRSLLITGHWPLRRRSRLSDAGCSGLGYQNSTVLAGPRRQPRCSTQVAGRFHVDQGTCWACRPGACFPKPFADDESGRHASRVLPFPTRLNRECARSCALSPSRRAAIRALDIEVAGVRSPAPYSGGGALHYFLRSFRSEPTNAMITMMRTPIQNHIATLRSACTAARHTDGRSPLARTPTGSRCNPDAGETAETSSSLCRPVASQSTRTVRCRP
jgi:hypothetical protein